MEKEVLAKKRKGMKLLLFPFKAFLLLVVLVFGLFPEGFNGATWSEQLISTGILFSFFGLFVGSIVQLRIQWSDAIETFLVILIFCIALAIVNPHTKNIFAI